MTDQDTAQQIAALGDFVKAHLAPHSAALHARMARLAGLDLPDDCIIYIEAHTAELTERMQVDLTLDAGLGTPRALYTAAQEDAGPDAPLLTQDQLHTLVIWETDGQDRVMAIEQPVIDVARVELKVLLPWMIECWAKAGVPPLVWEVVAGLHDSAQWKVLNEPRRTPFAKKTKTSPTATATAEPAAKTRPAVSGRACSDAKETPDESTKNSPYHRWQSRHWAGDCHRAAQ